IEIVRMHQCTQLVDRRDRLGRGSAEDATPLRAYVDLIARHVPVDQSVARTFERELEPLAAALERSLCQALNRHILDNMHVAEQRAAVEDRCRMQAAPDHGAVGM